MKPSILYSMLDSLEEKVNEHNLPNIKNIRRMIKELEASNPEELQPDPCQSKYDQLWREMHLVSKFPWKQKAAGRVSMLKASKILNKNHYGSVKVKNLILDYLAAIKLGKKTKSPPVLLLVGPPGTGKTTIAKSIAEAMNRPFEKIMVGGVADTNLAGVNPSYDGAKPGVLFSTLVKTKSHNPVILLDELDKVVSGHQSVTGDTYSNLLSVFDPSGHEEFADQYFAEFSFDLSGCLFICTANSLGEIPAPLLSRMDIVYLDSYDESEKIEIANNYIIPAIIKDYGLKKNHFKFERSALLHLIRNYTREGGVRGMSKKIMTVGRVVAREVLQKKRTHRLKMITRADVDKYLGLENSRHIEYFFGRNEPGLCLGLSRDANFSGDVLPIEAAAYSSKFPGKTAHTGELFTQSKESLSTVITFLRANSQKLGISKDIDLDSMVFHINYPSCVGSGVDGPSAGGAMLLAVWSLLTKTRLDPKTACTGQIDLRGNILPVGGIREKADAAYRAGMKKIIIPFGNKADIEFIPPYVKKACEIIVVDNIYSLFKAYGINI